MFGKALSRQGTLKVDPQMWDQQFLLDPSLWGSTVKKIEQNEEMEDYIRNVKKNGCVKAIR